MIMATVIESVGLLMFCRFDVVCVVSKACRLSGHAMEFYPAYSQNLK